MKSFVNKMTIINAQDSNDSRFSKFCFYIEIVFVGILSIVGTVYWLIGRLRRMPTRSINGATIVITNGCSPLTQGLARQFLLKHHCSVVLVFDESQKMEKSSSNLKNTEVNHSKLTRYQCNLLDNKQVKNLVEKINHENGRIDMVIDNTVNLGKENNTKDVHNFIQRTSQNILIFLQLLVNFVPKFIEQGGGSLVSLKSDVNTTESFLATKSEMKDLIRTFTTDEIQMKDIHLSTIQCLQQPDGCISKTFQRELLIDDEIVDRIIEGILKNESLVRVRFHLNIIEYCCRRGASALKRVLRKINEKGLIQPLRL